MGLVGGRGNIGSKVATLALALGAFLRDRPYAVPHIRSTTTRHQRTAHTSAREVPPHEPRAARGPPGIKSPQQIAGIGSIARVTKRLKHTQRTASWPCVG